MERRRRLIALVALLLAVAGLVGRIAAEGDAGAVVAGLERWLAGTKDLEGGFRQSLISGALGAGVEERGKVYVKRPGNMRWDYREPERKTAIVSGDRTWLYIAEERELTLGRLEEQGRLLPALLAGEQPISELFDARLLEPAQDGSPRLELRPRGAEEDFEHVVVELRAKDFAIRSAEVQDAAGNRMLYAFSDLRRNHGLPDGMFRFEPPPGTSVLGEH
jgi:outer membrane lipoprotein carrier protein